MSTQPENGESVDGIHVLHVNPSSIIVTDVPPSPSPPSTISLERGLRLLPSTMSTDSEVNVVFGSPALSRVTPIESQRNVAAQNGFPRIEVIETEKSSHGQPEEIREANEGDILCKITDVRSMQGVTLFSGDQDNERMLRSLQYEENKDCLPAGMESESKEMNSLDKMDKRHDHSPSDYFSKAARDNNIKNVSKVRYILPKTYKLHQNVIEKYHHTCSESLCTGDLATDNAKKNTGITNAITSDESLRNKINCLRTGEKVGDEKSSLHSSNEEGKFPENVEECSSERESQGSPTQISRLLNFVNSVSSSPLVKRVSAHVDVNNNSLLSSERSTLIGQKRARSMNQSDETFDGMDYSSVALKSVDQSTELLKSMDQSLKGMTKPSDLLNKLFKSIEPKNDYTSKELTCTEKSTSRIELRNLKYSRRQKSSYCFGDLQKSTDPACVETTYAKRLIVMENGGPAASSTSRSFPVVLGSYSIHPSQFSKQQIIELHKESRDPRVNVNVPAERFSQEKNVSDIVENSYNGSDKNNLNFTKSISNSFAPGNQCSSASSTQKEYIDLNLSTRTFGNMYKRKDNNIDHDCYSNKGVFLQAIYTFETKVSRRRAPDSRLPEIYSPTRATFTGYSSNLICSTLPIVTADGVDTSVSGKLHQKHRQR